MPLSLFTEISILVVVAALISLAMRILRQPLVIGHIITGLIVGPFVLDIARSKETLELFSQIGIAFLLFIVGISLDLGTVRKFGKIALVTGIGQMLVTTGIGYLLAQAMGFATLPSLYLGVALAFSSTIIIMKLISDKGDLERLYAKISIGFLIVQDLIAILLLFFIPLLSTNGGDAENIFFLFGKGVALTALVFLVAFFALPYLNRFLARSRELLFLFAIGWGIGLAALYWELGFSLETGALIAGVALSALPSRFEVSARLVPLRDFFIVLFFILLGSQMVVGNVGALLIPAIAFSLLVLVGNPLILMTLMGFLRYKKKTSLQTGFTVAQISEFSFILVALGVGIGHLEAEVLSLTTLVGLITIFGSTYFILYSDRIYNTLAPYLSIFERTYAREDKDSKADYDTLLIGYNRIGYNFLESFAHMKRNALVVDFNPETIEELTKKGVPDQYGDASDPDFLRTLFFPETTLVISTVPDFPTNLLILRGARASIPDATVMVVAHQIDDALALYREGADYVIMPHFLGGEHAASLVEKTRGTRVAFTSERTRHIESLKRRVALGQEHPEAEGLRFQ